MVLGRIIFVWIPTLPHMHQRFFFFLKSVEKKFKNFETKKSDLVFKGRKIMRFISLVFIVVKANI